MSSPPSGALLVRSWKGAAGAPGPGLVLPVGNPVQAWLRPVATQPARLDAHDIYCLTEWRNRHVHSFLTEFTATEARTAAWLTGVVGPDESRILFMVDDLAGTPLGYMGLAFINWSARSGEADAIVRGRETPRGLMTLALRTLLQWARGALELERITVRVRADNPALQFYRKFGFQELTRVALQRTEESGSIVWREAPELAAAPLYLVHLILPS